MPSSDAPTPGSSGRPSEEEPVVDPRVAWMTKAFGVPAEEITYGEPVARPTPWLNPLDRTTRPPPVVPVDESYGQWLLATLADVAEHYTLAASQAALRGDGRAGELRDTARLLRATALAAAASDSRWLHQGDLARRYLENATPYRVPTRVRANERESDPPFVLTATDVEPKETDTKLYLRFLLYSRLGWLTDMRTTPRWMEETVDVFVGAVGIHPWLVAQCSVQFDRAQIKAAWERAFMSCPAPLVVPLPKEEKLAVARIEAHREELVTFAEKLVIEGLVACGFPRGALRGFYSFIDKRLKKAAGADDDRGRAPTDEPPDSAS